jgi:hypothetical protein
MSSDPIYGQWRPIYQRFPTVKEGGLIQCPNGSLIMTPLVPLSDKVSIFFRNNNFIRRHALDDLVFPSDPFSVVRFTSSGASLEPAWPTNVEYKQRVVFIDRTILATGDLAHRELGHAVSVKSDVPRAKRISSALSSRLKSHTSAAVAATQPVGRPLNTILNEDTLSVVLSNLVFEASPHSGVAALVCRQFYHQIRKIRLTMRRFVVRPTGKFDLAAPLIPNVKYLTLRRVLITPTLLDSIAHHYGHSLETLSIEGCYYRYNKRDAAKEIWLSFQKFFSVVSNTLTGFRIAGQRNRSIIQLLNNSWISFSLHTHECNTPAFDDVFGSLINLKHFSASAVPYCSIGISKSALLSRLETLEISDCSWVPEFNPTEICPKLVSLRFADNQQLSVVNLKNCPSVRRLDINNCDNLFVPNSSTLCDIFKEIGSLKMLEALFLGDFIRVNDHSVFAHLDSLEHLKYVYLGNWHVDEILAIIDHVVSSNVYPDRKVITCIPRSLACIGTRSAYSVWSRPFTNHASNSIL